MLNQIRFIYNYIECIALKFMILNYYKNWSIQNNYLLTLVSWVLWVKAAIVSFKHKSETCYSAIQSIWHCVKLFPVLMQKYRCHRVAKSFDLKLINKEINVISYRVPYWTRYSNISYKLWWSYVISYCELYLTRYSNTSYKL